MSYAKGKYAKFISDRSGLEYPYTEMVIEWNGMRVHTSEYEPKAPQLMPHEHSPDPQALEHARPARVEPATERLLPLNAFRHEPSVDFIKVFDESLHEIYRLLKQVYSFDFQQFVESYNETI